MGSFNQAIGQPMMSDLTMGTKNVAIGNAAAADSTADHTTAMATTR